MMHEGMKNSYSQPKRGFLYLQILPYDQDVARRVWSDLKSVAGTRQVVGFDASSLPELHPLNDKAKPAFYPDRSGLVKINADQPRAKQLLEFEGN